LDDVFEGTGAESLVEQWRETGTVSLSLLSGVVSDLESSAPVAEATVVLSRIDSSERLVTRSNASGGFRFAGVPVGEYRLAASKTGFVSVPYGSKYPLHLGLELSVADTESKLEDLDLRLAKGATIAGSILDSYGNPIPLARVEVFRQAPTLDGLAFVAQRHGSSQTIADHLGTYRIFGLPPGTYIVQASPSSLVGVESNSFWFSPGVRNPDEAARVLLRLGEEQDGVDIRFRRVRGYALHGIVQGVPAELLRRTSVDVLSNRGVRQSAEEEPVVVVGTLSIDSQGRFRIPQLAPGNYQLQARVRGYFGVTSVALEDHDELNVVLELQESTAVGGSIAIDSTANEHDSGTVGTLMLRRSGGPTRVIDANADRKFVLLDLPPGHYSVSSTRLSDRFGVAFARLSGRDVTDLGFEVLPGASITDLNIGVSDQLAQFGGRLLRPGDRVDAAPNYHLILFPSDPSLWVPRSRRIAAAMSAKDGRFTFRNLRAGSYLLCVVENVEDNQWFDSTFLEALRPTSIEVVVKDRERLERDIKIR